MKYIGSIILTFCCFVQLSCQSTKALAQSSETKAVQVAHSSYVFPYTVNKPHKVFEMPKSLKEISGLSLSSTGTQLVAISDEFGILYFINKESGELEKEVEFYKDGDYEGVEIVGGKIFVVKSTGTLYEVGNLDGDSVTCIKHKYKLKKDNDVEGLAYDKKNNTLLVVCKGNHCHEEFESKEDCWKKKAVYSINLDFNVMNPVPSYVVELKDVREFLMNNRTAEQLKPFESNLKEDGELFKFNPSGLAIHPKTGNLYVIASKGKTIVVLSPKGKILHIEKLKKKLHTQPEGIAFDNSGVLFISNEGKGKEGKGTVSRFEMK